MTTDAFADVPPAVREVAEICARARARRIARELAEQSRSIGRPPDAAPSAGVRACLTDAGRRLPHAETR